MKIEKGMYVRTKFGEITKILNIDEISLEDGIGFYETKLTPGYCELDGNDITKASHDIIDLFKKNDIIIGKNGKLYTVLKVWQGYVFTNTKNKYGQTITLVDYQIDKFLTKEQFERYCYKVGEK